jgi:PIN domain nuclease of toxin-antitoxin system
MNILLDTHSFLWFVWNDPRLSQNAIATIESPTNRKWVSVASLWEITIKVSINKLELGLPIESFLTQHLSVNDFSVLNISTDHLSILSRLDFHHRDPFDRLLASQSISEPMSLISCDVVFDQYGVNRFW